MGGFRNKSVLDAGLYFVCRFVVSGFGFQETKELNTGHREPFETAGVDSCTCTSLGLSLLNMTVDTPC